MTHSVANPGLLQHCWPSSSVSMCVCLILTRSAGAQRCVSCSSGPCWPGFEGRCGEWMEPVDTAHHPPTCTRMMVKTQNHGCADGKRRDLWLQAICREGENGKGPGRLWQTLYRRSWSSVQQSLRWKEQREQRVFQRS